jgi:hypothetical protein
LRSVIIAPRNVQRAPTEDSPSRLIHPERAAGAFASRYSERAMMKNLIPKIFYDHMRDGLALFVEGLGFKLVYRDESLAVVEREGAKAYIVESPEFAAKDRPELTIETDDIESLYAELCAKHPSLLHPNAKRVTKKPWGALEFAVRDKTDVCVIFRQW